MREIKANELKQIELEMLSEIDNICKSNNITYYAIGGTLLGAIRHNGFIPWDDDIDIAMFKDDYNRFRNAIESSKFELRFDCIENSASYPYAYGKVCRTNTTIKEKHLKGYDDAGVFIDVFRIDGRGNKEQAQELFGQLNQLQASWLTSFSLQSEQTNNVLKNIYYKLRYLWRNRKTPRKWAESIDSVSKKLIFNWSEEEYCSWIHEKPFPNYIFKDVIYVQFENMLLPCPSGYDEFLKIKYGDYMTFPPEDERVSNHSFSTYGGGGNTRFLFSCKIEFCIPEYADFRGGQICMNYLICKWIGNENNAAVKATQDVNASFEKMGGEIIQLWKCNSKIIRNIQEMNAYSKLKCKVTHNDNIIIEWPLYSIKPYDDLQFTKFPHNKLICFVQDIESYRYNPEDNATFERDINFLNQFNAVIAHNQGMIDFLISNGLKTNIVDWQICDYIIDNPDICETDNEKTFELCYVGNLQSSDFLRVNSGLFQTHINFYGQLYDDICMTSQLTYKGIYNPNNRACKLEGSFGLVWEGNRIDTCDGVLGNYMRINNPNRLSMYLANNIPVITWKNAGLAGFIERYKVGITVDALPEVDEILSKMSREYYVKLLNNTKKIGEKIRKGFFAEQAIINAINGNYAVSFEKP